jgi:SET domain-containing protein
MQKIKIKKSGINGIGIFAGKSIKKNKFVGYIKGLIKRTHNTTTNDSLAFPDWVGFKRDEWIDPEPPFKYINHSCDPNCGIRGTKTVIAMRNIKEGEELVIDYAITECDTEWNFKKQTGSNCKCGSKKCRKIIRSIQFLPEEIYKKYLPFIPKAFQKEYLKAKTL